MKYCNRCWKHCKFDGTEGRLEYFADCRDPPSQLENNRQFFSPSLPTLKKAFSPFYWIEKISPLSVWGLSPNQPKPPFLHVIHLQEISEVTNSEEGKIRRKCQSEALKDEIFLKYIVGLFLVLCICVFLVLVEFQVEMIRNQEIWAVTRFIQHFVFVFVFVQFVLCICVFFVLIEFQVEMIRNQEIWVVTRFIKHFVFIFAFVLCICVFVVLIEIQVEMIFNQESLSCDPIYPALMWWVERPRGKSIQPGASSYQDHPIYIIYILYVHCRYMDIKYEEAKGVVSVTPRGEAPQLIRVITAAASSTQQLIS